MARSNEPQQQQQQQQQQDDVNITLFFIWTGSSKFEAKADAIMPTEL